MSVSFDHSQSVVATCFKPVSFFLTQSGEKLVSLVNYVASKIFMSLNWIYSQLPFSGHNIQPQIAAQPNEIDDDDDVIKGVIFVGKDRGCTNGKTQVQQDQLSEALTELIEKKKWHNVKQLWNAVDGPKEKMTTEARKKLIEFIENEQWDDFNNLWNSIDSSKEEAKIKISEKLAELIEKKKWHNVKNLWNVIPENLKKEMETKVVQILFDLADDDESSDDFKTIYSAISPILKDKVINEIEKRLLEPQQIFNRLDISKEITPS